jgi:hypothetical protein
VGVNEILSKKVLEKICRLNDWEKIWDRTCSSEADENKLISAINSMGFALTQTNHIGKIFPFASSSLSISLAFNTEAGIYD